jgi:uncharacterized protein (TIGR03435 family)
LGQSAGTTAPEARFEVVSIKPNTLTFEEYMRTGGGSFFIGSKTMPGGRLIASYTPLRPLLLQAFEIPRPMQLEGAPQWLQTDNFDIDARSGRDVTPAELNAMLRTMFSERLGLRTHVVTRDVTVYAVTLAQPDGRPGSNLRPSSTECVATLAKRQAEGLPREGPEAPQNPEIAPVCGVNWTGRGESGGKRLSFGGTTIAYLLRSLESEFDAPLDDRTGLSGSFDLVLEFESTARQRGGRAGVGAPSGAPAIRDALQNQLGLKIEKTVARLPITIIDSITRPTSN